METIRKIIRAVRLVLGWTMALTGAVGCAACLTFFVLTVMGKLEITTTLEYIMAASLLMAGILLFWHISLWGFRVKDVPDLYDEDDEDEEEEEEDAPAERQPAESAAEAVAAFAAETAEEPEMMPDMAALSIDLQPFAAYEKETALYHTLEDRSDVAAYFLLREGASLRSAVGQYLDNGRLSRPVHIRICDQSVLDGLEEGFLRMCQENLIRVVEYEGGYHVYDHAGKQRYSATIKNCEGGANDGVAYGYWSFG